MDTKSWLKKVGKPLALLGVVIVAVVGYVLVTDEGSTEESIEVASYEPESTNQMIEDYYAGSLSASQMQESLNDYLDYSPQFKTTEDIENESENDENQPTEAVEKTLEMKEIITAYLDGLYIQQDKLNKVASNLSAELSKYEEVTEESLNDSNEPIDIDGLNSPSVEGLLNEMANTPLYLHSDNEEYSVWVDYELLNEKYDKFFSLFHKNLTRLHKDIVRFGYRRADGEIDARVIYNRLLLIDDIQDGNISKDDYYWENERYQLAILFTGYGAEELPEWDERRISQMEEIVTKSEDTNKYKDVAKNLLETIDGSDSGQYGEETVRVANEWMHREFSEYSEYVEEQSTQANNEQLSE